MSPSRKDYTNTRQYGSLNNPGFWKGGTQISKYLYISNVNYDFYCFSKLLAHVTYAMPP